MPPKKGKGRKRGSLDDAEKLKDENTDLLSPSEVVKMRKKSRTLIQETPPEPPKEKDTKSNRSKVNRVVDKTTKRDKTREQDKKKDGRSKKDKSERVEENKRPKPLKEKKKNMKKKLKSEDCDPEHVPILYPCGICTKEVSDADDAILCEAGCEFWYHRMCTGMTDIAYQLLTNEENAEWVCDKCITTKSVPLVKIKSFEGIS